MTISSVPDAPQFTIAPPRQETPFDSVRPISTFPELQRLPTQIPGLDTILGGGLMVGDAYLLAGEPGTGKTTLGNQVAFAHAAAGGAVVFATLLTESHDRMLAHLHDFDFADRSLVGERVHYISLLGSLQEGGFEELVRLLVETLRTHRATLLVIDGAGAARMLADSDFDYARFMHGLQARTALLNCTMMLLAGEREADVAATHVGGLIQLFNRPTNARDTRWVRVAKLRGSNYLNGQHRFAIGSNGITVFPRLESASAEAEAAWFQPHERLPFGVLGLDAMVAGGLQEGSATLAIGTAGAGKTLLGLHFLAEGARRGEQGLIASFNETPRALASGAGMGLGPHFDSGLVQSMWRPPLELAPGEWAWQLLAAIDEHQPRRLVIDAFSDLMPLFAIPERTALFPPALVNRLRARKVTTIFVLEIDAFASPSLSVPVQNLSATMDNGILMRTTELRSPLHRMISVLKQRQTAFDPTIREFTIGPHGISVGEPFDASALMTGTAAPPWKVRRHGSCVTGRMKRILAVDDEPEILELLVEILRIEGYAISSASDGRAALELLEGTGADLVITDTMMPRVDGVALIRSMRDSPGLCDIPVIIMSAAGRPRLDGLDICAFLHKPFDLIALLDAVAEAIDCGPSQKPSA